MAKRRTSTLKWKNLGFVPEGWDESKMIEYGDPGFLYLCRQLRDDWRSFRGYTIKDLKWKPGQGGCDVSHDWTGLNEALFKVGGNPDPPPIAPSVKLREFSPEERESLGRDSHRHWVSVNEQRRALGRAVHDDEPRAWDDLSDEQREVYRKSADSLAMPEYLMWDAVAQMRQRMGEKAFRKKLFELSVSVTFEKMLPSWSEAERYRATDLIVKLSEMLDVSPGEQPATE